MKLLLTTLLLSLTAIVFSQTPTANNEKAILVNEFIEKHKITDVEIQYRKGIFTSREFYTKWSFPGANLIMLNDRAYNLDCLQFFELFVYNAGFDTEKRTLVLKLTKIK